MNILINNKISVINKSFPINNSMPSIFSVYIKNILSSELAYSSVLFSPRSFRHSFIQAPYQITNYSFPATVLVLFGLSDCSTSQISTRIYISIIPYIAFSIYFLYPSSISTEHNTKHKKQIILFSKTI